MSERERSMPVDLKRAIKILRMIRTSTLRDMRRYKITNDLLFNEAMQELEILLEEYR